MTTADARPSPHNHYLTDARHSAIVRVIGNGGTLKQAAAAAHVGYRTVQRWIADGEHAATYLDTLALDPQAPTAAAVINTLWTASPTTRHLDPITVPEDAHDDAGAHWLTPGITTAAWRLWRDVDRVRDSFMLGALNTIIQTARGYDAPAAKIVTTTKVETLTDEAGNVVGENTEVTTVQTDERVRDWKAAAWLLERMDPARFARITRHEVTGAEGGPVEVSGLDARAEVERVLNETADRLGLPTAIQLGPGDLPASLDGDGLS